MPEVITLYVPSVARPYLPDPMGLGLAIQTDLAAAGIEVQIAAPEWPGIWLSDWHAGFADLFLIGVIGVNGDPDSFLCPLFCGAEATFNSTRRGAPLPPDAELAELLLRARATLDPDERQLLYAQALGRIFENVPAVPIAYRNSAWGFRAEIDGYVPSPVESLFFEVRRKPLTLSRSTLPLRFPP